jgi:signal peptidase I
MTPRAALLTLMTVATIGAALAARPCVVAGSSMEPALHGEDVILVVRSTATALLQRQPRVGDVVVVRVGRLNLLGKGPGVAIVKRVAAIGGDIVEAREDDGLFVNGRRIADVPTPFSAKVVAGTFYRYRRSAGGEVFRIDAGGNGLETMPAERGGTAIQSAPAGPLPPGTVFVLGDNPVVSFDSLRFGPVGVGEIEGTALAVLYRPGTR